MIPQPLSTQALTATVLLLIIFLIITKTKYLLTMQILFFFFNHNCCLWKSTNGFWYLFSPFFLVQEWMEILAQVEKVINLGCFSWWCLCVFANSILHTSNSIRTRLCSALFIIWSLFSGEASHLLFVTIPNAWGGLSGFIFQQGSKEQWVVVGKLSFCKVEHCPFLRVQFRWSLVAL